QCNRNFSLTAPATHGTSLENDASLRVQHAKKGASLASADKPHLCNVPPVRADDRDLQRAQPPSSGALLKLLYQRDGLQETPFGVTPTPVTCIKAGRMLRQERLLSLALNAEFGFQALIAAPEWATPPYCLI